MGRKCLKLGGSRDEGETCLLGNLLSNGSIISLSGVETSSYRRTAKSQTVKGGQRTFDALNAIFHLLGVPAKFLPKSQWRCVLAVGPANFDNLIKFSRLGSECRMQLLQAREGDFRHNLGTRNVHGGRKGIVGTLSHVTVIIGMDRRLATDLTTQNLNGSVGKHFVYVHISLGS